MAQGREFAESERLSHLMALLANCHRGRNSRQAHPHDFFRRPGVQRERKKLTVDSLYGLREMFTKRF